MPWLAEVARDITSARKASDLVALVKEEERFDKVILPRESNFSADMIPLIATLLDDHTTRGIFVAFPSDDGWSIEQAAEFYFPDCRQWAFPTQFGDVFIAEFNPTTWRFIHG